DNFFIKDSVKNFINEFKKKNPIFIVTGREEKFIKRLAKGLEPTGWILENGAIFIYNNQRILNVDDDWFQVREDVVKFLEANKVKFSLGEVIIYVDEASKYFDVLNKVSNAKIEWNRNNLMILPKNIDKGSSILKFIRRFNLNGKIVVIGDGENDLSMFKVADIKVAVKNAVDVLKYNADFITDKEDGEGVVEFLRFLSSFSK
ncbi:MAG: phosphoglycolate phosphatase, partial [Sulfolobaceae archaeon]